MACPTLPLKPLFDQGSFLFPPLVLQVSSLLHYLPVAVLQRFGYLMERVIGDAEFAASLFDRCRQAGLTFFRIPLHPSLPTKGFSSDARWKVIVNVEIALEE